MNEKTIILGSLALDLKRVAIGYHRRSIKMGDRFMGETLKRVEEAESLHVKSYLKKQLSKIKKLQNENDLDKKAEDALMYSVIVQNYCLKYL